MADKRKFFRARRLACGGRILPRLLAASLAVVLAAGPVHAQEAGLKSGAASLAAGKYDAAVRQLSAAINAGTASPGDAAKALYLRGIAYRKMGEPARAAADLGAAIWLGLPEADRVKALVNRGLAFKAAGLSKESEAEFASARKVGGSREVDQLIADGGGTPEGAAAIAAFSTEVRPEGQASAPAKPRSGWLPSFGRGDAGDAAPAPQPEPTPTRTASASPQASAPTSKPADAGAPGAWSTSVASEQQKSSSSGGNRLTRWFGSRTDSSPAAPTPAAPAPAPAETVAASPPPSKPPSAPPAAAASSSWSTTTAGQDASSAAGASESKRSWRIFGRTAEADQAAQPAATSSAVGGYRLQLATSRSEDEAKALWKKVSQSQGLGGVSPEIEKVDIGNFGTFYSLKIGPFPDKAQSLKVCNALKRSGIDCSPVTL
jgi:tetratricopeptide (TPR) repeat protein